MSRIAQNSRLATPKIHYYVLIGLVCCLSTARAADTETKQLEASAKKAVADAVALEKSGDLKGAREGILKAEGIYPTRDAENAMAQLDAREKKEVEGLIAKASTAYGGNDYAGAAGTLEKARELQPGNATVNFNLALADFKLGKNADAVALLDSAIPNVRDEKQRDAMEQLRAAAVTGEPGGQIAADSRASVDAVNKGIADVAKAEEGGETDSDGEKTVCKQLQQVESVITRTPSVLFNLAKCAEEEGKEDDAIRYFSEYDKAAPNAIDVDEVQLRLELLKSLAALKDGNASKVRDLYASAFREIAARRYKEALDDYRSAAELMPGFPETFRKMGILTEALGDVGGARKYYQQYLSTETSPERKTQVQGMLDALDRKKADYDKSIAEARSDARAIVEKYFSSDSPISFSYALDRFMKADEKAQAAAILFPLAPEISELRAFIYEQTNNYRGARNSLDALSTNNMAFFYGAITSDSEDKKVNKLGKFELDNGHARFVTVSTYDLKKKKTEQISPASGSDGLAEFATGIGYSGKQFSGLTLATDDIKKLETREFGIYVETSNRKLLIEPIHLAAGVPDSGPAARRYYNNYTRMFQRYMGFDDAKLGSEKMTVGEKLQMGLTIANAGLTAYSAVSNVSNLVGSARMLMAISSAATTTLAQIQRYVVEQRQVVAGLQFRTIPAEPLSLSFVNELK